MFKTAPRAFKVGDTYKGRRSGKLFTITGYHHSMFGGHDIIHLKAEDGEEKQVASFRLNHKYEKVS